MKLNKNSNVSSVEKILTEDSGQQSHNNMDWLKLYLYSIEPWLGHLDAKRLHTRPKVLYSIHGDEAIDTYI